MRKYAPDPNPERKDENEIPKRLVIAMFLGVTISERIPAGN